MFNALALETVIFHFDSEGDIYPERYNADKDEECGCPSQRFDF